jgi:HAD superfamily hydrolase (TIGR01549 family)
MTNPEVIIYDFDGVICDSVNIKTEAFVDLYKSFEPKIQAQVREYHLLNGGISRYEKFKFFQSILLGKEVSEDEIINLSSQFSALVKEKVIASEYIKGAYNFIKRNAFKKQFICSGTPEIEIYEISEKKGISSFFQQLYGSPKTKTEIINIILTQTKVSRDKCIFFGDAMTDYNAAQFCAIPFIGIKNAETTFPDGTIIIRDFEDLVLNLYI